MAIIERKDSAGNLIYRIDKITKRGSYNLATTSRQLPILEKTISFVGLVKLPSGFYKDGYGLTRAGAMILEEVKQKYNKKIKLTITANTTKIDLKGKIIKLHLAESLLSGLGNSVRAIKRVRNAEMTAEARNVMGTNLTQFKNLKGSKPGYIAGQLAMIMGLENISKKLSHEDTQALEDFIPTYLKSITGTLRAKKKMKIVYDTLNAGKKIYMSKVIKEFKTKLKKPSQSENVWQRFLSEHILEIQSHYGQVLEKSSVSLQGKFPDFMLIDPYGYLDIYEIKKPSTILLKLDTSRNNYYWDVEVSKAIAQVENYIHQAQRHSDALASDIKTSKNLEISIVKPRGFIVAGLRSQLNNKKMKDDFRILCDSLKNVDVILYDDLLKSLEAFSN